MESTDQVWRFVDNVGVFCEQLGLQRMVGRILGHLIVCTPAHQSMDNLVDALQTSKGSISTSSRWLVESGLVERVRFPGNRKDYFRLKENVWPVHLHAQLKKMMTFKSLVLDGLNMLQNAPAEQKERLIEMKQFYDWLGPEIDTLFKRWNQFKSNLKQENSFYPNR